MEGDSFLVDFFSTFSDLNLTPVVFGVLGVLVIIILIFLINKSVRIRKAKKIYQKLETEFEETVNYANMILNVNVKPKTLATLAEVDVEGVIKHCVELAEKIDIHCNRPGNFKKIGPLVYKICRHLNLDSKKCALYFCASLVYDMGFLDLPEDLFVVDILSKNERKRIQSHVTVTPEKLEFAPDEFKSVFEEAIKYHHESMDGTGFPEGLSGQKIPLVARIIHVAESYISMVTPRNYHRKKNPISALKQLETQSHSYDSSLVKALGEVVFDSSYM